MESRSTKKYDPHWPECDDARPCRMQVSGREKVYCVGLTTKDKTPPYKPGECPFYKPKATENNQKEPSANGSDEKDESFDG